MEGESGGSAVGLGVLFWAVSEGVRVGVWLEVEWKERFVRIMWRGWRMLVVQSGKKNV